MENPKKIAKYISDSLSNMSSMLFNSSSDHVEQDITDAIEISNIDTLTSQEWSKDNCCDETIIMKKSDYDKVMNELSFSRMQNTNYKIKEREYIRMKNDYDKTVSYLLENNHTVAINNPPDKSVIEENDINRLRAAELRLKSHIKALKKDLFDSEQRADAFKCIAQSDAEVMKEEIGHLKSIINTERERNADLAGKLRRLEDILQNRCEETVELIEYCKYLLR